MAKSISKDEVLLKIEFLNQFMDAKWGFVLEDSSNSMFSLWKDYGLEGSDCILENNLQKINQYLNSIIRKEYLKEDWLSYKNNI